MGLSHGIRYPMESPWKLEGVWKEIDMEISAQLGGGSHSSHPKPIYLVRLEVSFNCFLKWVLSPTNIYKKRAVLGQPPRTTRPNPIPWPYKIP